MTNQSDTSGYEKAVYLYDLFDQKDSIAFFFLLYFPNRKNSYRSFAVACLSGVYDHFLDDKERVRSLSNIGHHLELGGILVFDVFLGLMKDLALSPAGSVKVGDWEYRRFVGGQLLPGKKKEMVLIFEEYEGDALVKRIEERSLVGLTDRCGVYRWRNTVIGIGVGWVLVFFSIPHLIDDFLYGILEEFGLTNQQT